MNETINTGDPAAAEPQVWRLAASLQIQDVDAQFKILAQLLHERRPIVIDVSSLATVDTAGVQLLLAVRHEAARRGVQFGYRGESAALNQALGTLGLRDAVLDGAMP